MHRDHKHEMLFFHILMEYVTALNRQLILVHNVVSIHGGARWWEVLLGDLDLILVSVGLVY